MIGLDQNLSMRILLASLYVLEKSDTPVESFHVFPKYVECGKKNVTTRGHMCDRRNWSCAEKIIFTIQTCFYIISFELRRILGRLEVYTNPILSFPIKKKRKNEGKIGKFVRFSQVSRFG